MCPSSRCDGDIMTKSFTWLTKVPCAGMILAILAGMCFATAGFIVKLIPHVNPVQVVFSRSIVQLTVYLPIVIYYKLPILGIRGERWSLGLRGIFGFVASTLSYASYHMIPLADVSTIVSSAPVYVSIFACIMLKEECGLFQVFNIVITMAGIILISKPTFLFPDHKQLKVKNMEISDLRIEGTIIAFVSAVCYAFTFVLIRKMQKTPSAIVIAAFSFISIICCSIVMMIMYVVFSDSSSALASGIGLPQAASEYGWLIANGMCGVLAQLLLTVSLKIEEAGLVSLGRTFEIIFAFLFQLIWFPRELIHLTSYLGAVLVTLGVCISAIRRWLKSKPELYAKITCSKHHDDVTCATN